MSDSAVLITPAKVSEKLGTSIGTLAIWRCTGRYGLRFVKIGSKVMYRADDVERFIESRTRGGAAAKPRTRKRRRAA